MTSKTDPKIVQIAKLISILASGEAFTATALAERLETSRTSVYRYIESLRQSGLPVVCQDRSFSFATETSSDLSKILYFTGEEANALVQAISTIHDDTVFKQHLRNKLLAFIDTVSLPKCTIKSKNAGNVHAVAMAIRERKQVILHDYASSNSASVRDRHVEPFGFTTNYAEIWCYDLDDGKNKTFRTARITNAEMLPISWEHGHSHRRGFVDVFRMTGYDRYRVKIRLGVMAYNLLIEEYPLAEAEVFPVDDTHWLLDTFVANYRGVGRFAIGLADDIEIIDTPDLVKYIQDYTTKNLTTLSS